MKHFKSLKNWALLGVVALFAAGCAKTTDPGPDQPISTMAVYNVSPDAPKVQFKLNSSVINTDSAAYGTYGFYFNAYAGSRELSAYQREIKKVSAAVDLQDGKIYSAWLTGSWATPEFVVLEDKLANPPAGKAYVRFVNMSVDAPALELGTNTGNTITGGRTYKTGSDFVEITGGQSYNFVIRDNGSTTDKVLLPSVTIQTGRIYTIAAKGFYNGTGNSGLTGDVLINY